ncbi:MAG: glutamate synthase subunit beta [Methylococcales bacterium]|jgi:glutamate synthase (NADPH) small chain|nr:glutamate synthase subunit beta [Methylococcales bacterium]
MGKPTGFIEIPRQERRYQPAADRVQHYDEFVISLTETQVSEQGARCMDCGIPYCHTGCPVNNMIPDWNDAAYLKNWAEALDILHSTNNFPEFTGRICPAPCEAACTLNIDDNPVTIKTIECSIVDRGWEENRIRPQVAKQQSGKRVAVIGSGPAGLAAAQQLARAGHAVTVFEKNDRIGGLLRYGIPDFKLNKEVISRRLTQLRAEGVEFHTNAHIGVNISTDSLLEEYDALILSIGSEKPRDLSIDGRSANGVHFAMDFLMQQNKRVAGDTIPEDIALYAQGKHVVVIGGGDTGSDCIGTSNRQGAVAVTQLEIMPQPPEKEDKSVTWPDWPLKMRTSSSQEEGCDREFAVSTKAFKEENGQLTALTCVKLEWKQESDGRWSMAEIPDSEFDIKADLAFLAMGFIHPRHRGLLENLGVDLDEKGNVKADTETYQTSVEKVFVAGDTRRGQSLVVWAIREGRQAARSVDEFLMGRSSDLPR